MLPLMLPQLLDKTGPVTTYNPSFPKASSRTQSSNLDQIPRLKEGAMGDILDM
jgi:hypothetical protein